MNWWCAAIDQLPFAWAHYKFMQYALLAVILTSPIFALLGCLVVSNQMAFFSEAIGHAALAGIGLGVLMGLPDPSWSMLVFGVIFALSISFLKRNSNTSTDTAIGLTMSFCVALGIVLLSRGGGFGKYSRYLIGDMLTIGPEDLKRLALLFLIIVSGGAFFFNQLFLVTASHSLARSRAISIWKTEAVFAVLVAIVVTLSIPWVGLLVINSLLILPAASSRNIAQNTFQYVLGALSVSCISGIIGLLCSYYWGTATGATIVLTATVFFLISLIIRRR